MFLSSLSVKQKLMVPVYLLIILLVVVGYFFLKNKSVVESAHVNLGHIKSLSNDIVSYSNKVEAFIYEKQGFSEIRSDYETIDQSLKDKSIEGAQPISSLMQNIQQNASRINDLFSENRNFTTELENTLALSIKQSNDYLTQMITRLADPEARVDVSTFERQIMHPALSNTDKNYQVKFLFEQLKADLSNEQKLFDYLNVMEAENAEAIKLLQGTPALALAETAGRANGKVKDLADRYVNNVKESVQIRADIDETVVKMLEMLEELNDSSLESAFDRLSDSFVNIIVIMSFVVAATIMCAMVFATSIVKPLNSLERYVDELASKGGDLTFRVNVEGKDEIGRLAGRINAFLESLQTVFRDVKRSGEQISNSAKDSAGQSNQTMGVMERQRKETSIVANSFQEMESAILEISRNATQAADIVNQTAERSKDVEATLNITLTNIGGVNSNLSQAAEVINTLNQDSQNVGKILDVIRSIAEQTNLLALNAAIEAARAGEQGRGFAVVADEVRSLAQRTQSSIEEISSMISTLQAAATQANSVIEKGNEMIASTTEQSQQAGSGVQDISGLISEMLGMNLQIASAVEEQSAVAQQINNSLRAISDLAGQSSEAAVGSNRAASEQADHADQLRQVISRFKV